MTIHMLMVAIIAMTIWPVIGAVRYSTLLGSALELACVPQIKDRLMDGSFHKNWIVCVQHRQLITLYYPFVVAAMLFNTLAIWYMYSQEVGVPAAYLLGYCVLASGYGSFAYLFQSHPVWLRSWINNMELMRATINLEEVNTGITRRQIDLVNATNRNDLERVAELERELKHLAGLGEIYLDEIKQKEKPH